MPTQTRAHHPWRLLWAVFGGAAALLAGCALDTEGAAAGPGGSGGSSVDASQGGSGGVGGTGGSGGGPAGSGGTETGGSGGTAGAAGSVVPPDASPDVEDAGVPDADASTDVTTDVVVEADADADAEAGEDAAEEPPLGEPGEPCDDGADCLSGFCVDAVCCSTACDQTCAQCDATGTCVPIPAGTDPDGECSVVCQACDGNFGCSGCPSSLTCASILTDDCDQLGSCVACVSDVGCHTSTGRCEGCACVPRLGAGEACDESSDCVSELCGPGVAADPRDCDTHGLCAECDADIDCNGSTGRCDGCACVDKEPAGQPCDEATDCVSNRCGAGIGADPDDCTAEDVCVRCDADVQCPTGRCEACGCEQKLPKNEACDENSDCESGVCNPSDKCA